MSKGTDFSRQPIDGKKIPHFLVTQIKWFSGNRLYAILFLNDRLLFAKVGGQFSDVNSASCEYCPPEAFSMIREKTEQKISEIKKFPLDKILEMDKQNFEILYRDITRIFLNSSHWGINGPREGKLIIESKIRHKFDITLLQDYEECKNIIQMFLLEKLTL